MCMAAGNLQGQACLLFPTAARPPRPAPPGGTHAAHLPCSLPLTKTKGALLQGTGAGTRQQEMPGPAFPSACLSRTPSPAPSGLLGTCWGGAAALGGGGQAHWEWRWMLSHLNLAKGPF